MTDAPAAPHRVIGSRTTRFDAQEKVTGEARYLADLTLPGMLYGVLLLSAHPHARVLAINPGEAEAMPEVEAVVTYRDVPDRRYGPLVKDQRLFAKEGEKVTYTGDVIAAVAATGLAADPEAALAADAPLIHPEYEHYEDTEGTIRHGNDCGYTTVVKGDVDAAFEQA